MIEPEFKDKIEKEYRNFIYASVGLGKYERNTSIIPYVEELFPEVPGDILIRPQLKHKDLELIRRAFMTEVERGGINVEIEYKNLYYRMLRKVKL